MPENIVFLNTQSPGDILVMTAMLRDLHLNYPGRFATDFRCSPGCEDIFINNPFITKNLKSAKTVRVEYPLIHKCNDSTIKPHFLWGPILHINEKLNLNVKLTSFKPEVYLTKEEKTNKPFGLDKPYWVIVAGSKYDFTAKAWGIRNKSGAPHGIVPDHRRYEKVTEILKDKVHFVQVGLNPSNNHYHEPIPNCTNLIGKTSIRELLNVVYHSEGVLCPVTCVMHMAAAFDKPAVVIAGGREPYWWSSYPLHRHIHTIGSLDCCAEGGCWKNGMGENKRSNCSNLVETADGKIQKCMDIITPEFVADEVLKYYDSSHKLITLPQIKVLPKEPPAGGNTYKSKQIQDKMKKTKAPPKIPTAPNTLNGKHTIMSVLYGNKNLGQVKLKNQQIVSFHDLHLTTLKSFNDYAGAGAEIRLGLNVVDDETYDYIKTELSKKHNVKVWRSNENVGRISLMKEMIDNLNTNWVSWFDDDTYITGPEWRNSLEYAVNKFAPQNVHQFGQQMFYWYDDRYTAYIKTRPWYRDKPFRLGARGMHRSPKSDFIVGGYWTISRTAIEYLDWPDMTVPFSRQDDLILGEALYQNGANILNFFDLVNIDTAERRGDMII